MTRPVPTRVAIVGGGASGVLAATHLTRAAHCEARPLEITIFEPGRLGAGIAYSTRDQRHRLNVPAAGMSAFPDDPEHFLRWLRDRRDVDFPASGFALRRDFGAYLTDVLAGALDEATEVGFDHVRTKVADLVPTPNGWQIQLQGGITATADAVILALGAGPPSTAWAPRELLDSAHFVADPWAAPVRDDDVPGRDGSVLLVGAGLTMADLAMSWGRDGATIHVVSRHGMMPLAHVADPPAKPAAPQLPDADEMTLGEVIRYVFGHVRGNGANWRGSIDSLNPLTSELWLRIPEHERASFVRGSGGALRRWGRVRHRVAPDVGEWLESAVASGQVVPHEGTVASAHDVAGKVEVRLTTGTKIVADVVVNCTGPANDPMHSGEPLIRALLATGVAHAHPVGIGLDVAPDGSLRNDRVLPPLWTIGPLRQGELWETTAIPEIRVQAAKLPQQLWPDLG